MNRRRRIVPLVLVALLFVGLLGLAGYAGYSEGYSVGVAEGVEGVGRFGDGFAPYFIGVGLFFKIALALLLFFVIVKIFGFFAWRTAGGPRGGYGPGHWRGYHHRGHRGEHDEPYDESGGPEIRA